MRNPSGYGTIKKLSGKRRRPYAVAITTKYEMASGRKDISFLKEYLDADLFDEVCRQYAAACPELPKARQKQTIIGYYETRQAAMIALAEYNKNPFDTEKAKVTFSQVYDQLYQQEFSLMRDSARIVYKTAYNKCKDLHSMRMRDIKLAHLQAQLDQFKEQSKSTQKQIITLMHAVYSYCLQHDILEKDYSQFVKVTSTIEAGEKNPFSKDEIQLCWNEIYWMHPVKNKNIIDQPSIDTILMMIYSGMRINELLNLKKTDIHLKDRWINVEGTKTKAAKRIVPIHKKIIPLIESRLQSDSEYLICDSAGNQIPYSRYRSMFFDHFRKEFKIDRTAHECRHTFVTAAAASGMNQILLKKIIGHATADVTEAVYTHTYIDDLVKEIDKLNL